MSRRFPRPKPAKSKYTSRRFARPKHFRLYRLAFTLLPIAVFTLSSPILSTESRHLSAAQVGSIASVARPALNIPTVTQGLHNLNNTQSRHVVFSIENEDQTSRNQITLSYLLSISASDTVDIRDFNLTLCRVTSPSASDCPPDITIRLNPHPTSRTVTTDAIDLDSLGFVDGDFHHYLLIATLDDYSLRGQSFDVIVTAHDIMQYLPGV
ncbi:hypothetical protein FWH13_00085 [Candidatus Saccharibacteria bacterium]|nr:hypothetical protein [Candidatus Saccharibacteria bacterium]